jgi:SAM-dependent methyltransferase
VAPAGVYDETICCDVTDYLSDAQADIVICAALLEHVRDTGAALRGIASLLKPRGVALLFVHSRNAVYTRINRITPEWFKRWLPRAIYGDFAEIEAGLIGFPAYYDRCTPRDICAMAQTTGFSIESLRVYFASAYMQFLPPLRVAWRLWQILFRKLVGDQAAETMSVVLRKTRSPQKQKCDASERERGICRVRQ